MPAVFARVVGRAVRHGARSAFTWRCHGNAARDAGVAARARHTWSVTTILSIQSPVAYGHVNSAAVFPMQRLGVEVWPVHTVHFSNHTGMAPGAARPGCGGRARGHHRDGERDAFPEVDAVLSGHQGGTQIGDVILGAVEQVKAANPDAIYACDPVMGNAKSGLFRPPRHSPCCCANGLCPRPTSSRPTSSSSASSPTPSRAIRVHARLGRRGCGNGSLDGARHLRAAARPPGRHHRDAGRPRRRRVMVRTEHLPIKVNGSGDVTAALFTTHPADRGSGSRTGSHGVLGSPGQAHPRLGATRAPARAEPGADRAPADAVRGRKGPLTIHQTELHRHRRTPRRPLGPRCRNPDGSDPASG